MYSLGEILWIETQVHYEQDKKEHIMSVVRFSYDCAVRDPAWDE